MEGVKNTGKYFQVLFEHILANDIENPAQVECGKDQSHIGWGMFDGAFAHDIIKAPLPFDDAIGMLYNSLPSSIKRLI